MQIDFHHAVTYVTARYAGFGHRDAATVAYCAQYVDDASNSGTVSFDTGAMYSRISSAHKMLDYRHFDKLASHYVWIPFHFLPGNGMQQAGENPQGSFIDKIICRPNSPVAREMVRACIAERSAIYGLHRLGVTMHVLADTWAHQGFAGVCHKANDIKALDDNDQPERDLVSRLKDFFGDLFDEASGRFLGDALPLGHGPALSYPDRPYLRWNYRDHHGTRVRRDNPKEFSEAANELCKAMQRFRIGDADGDVPGLPDEGRRKIDHLLVNLTDSDGEKRHGQWLKHINEGYFGFPPVKLEYRAKGLNSWKYEALGTRKIKDRRGELFPYNPTFLGSDWKLFHDALQAHRFTVIYGILPRFGICAA